MHFVIPFISWIVSAKAFDNLFFDDQSNYNDNLQFGTDSSSDSIFSMNSDLSSLDYANESFDEGVEHENGEDWNILPAGNAYSAEYLADAPNECSLEPEAASKLHKSRRTECRAQDAVKDFPPLFFDLSNDIQDQLYRRWSCPSKSPAESLVPVCSSRLPQNSHYDNQISNPEVWSYTLMDSFICTSVRDRILFRI